jgi:protein gp37
MSLISSIEWTNSTWNPVTGCTKLSPGCANCYAERLSKRLKSMGNPRYSHGFQVCLHNDLLTLPLKWKKPRLVFVNSMSDLFHEMVPFEFIEAVFTTIQSTPSHTFQILTKRARRLAEMSNSLPWPNNLWIGVSIENQDFAWRAHYLSQVPASVKFISFEPLLGFLELPLDNIQWVIVGGESGPGARPMDLNWARSIRNRCIEAKVAFFLKQLGGTKDKRGKNQALLDGRAWKELPLSSLVTVPV